MTRRRWASSTPRACCTTPPERPGGGAALCVLLPESQRHKRTAAARYCGLCPSMAQALMVDGLSGNIEVAVLAALLVCQELPLFGLPHNADGMYSTVMKT